jgi:hypothetical protein
MTSSARALRSALLMPLRILSQNAVARFEKSASRT